MIRKAEMTDLPALAGLGALLWPHHSVEELAEEFAETMQKEGAAFFLAVEGQTPVGFAQCQLRRDYVEGTESSPVGQLLGEGKSEFQLPADAYSPGGAGLCGGS